MGRYTFTRSEPPIWKIISGLPHDLTSERLRKMSEAMPDDVMSFQLASWADYFEGN